MGLFERLFPARNTYAEDKQKALEKYAKEYFGEMGIFKDDTYTRGFYEDYNPDDMTLDIYDKMLQDGQVAAAISMIKLTLLAKGYTVQGDDDETKEYAEFINTNFEQMQGHLEDTLKEMLTAIEYGYSCTEKVFEYRDGAIMLKKLKVLPPDSVKITTNRFGDIERVTQRVGSKEIDISPEKIIWWAYEKRFGNLYGQSDLRRVYKHWFIRDKMYRFANVAYERYGTPLLVGQTKDGGDVGTMKRLLASINGLTGLAISEGDKIEAINGTQADFVGYINHHGQQIMTTMLVPPMLLNLAEGQGGSYSLSENQLDIFIFRIQALQRQLKNKIEEELIRPLIDLNYPNATAYPSFTFNPLVDKDLGKLATVFTQLISGKVIEPDEAWIREKLGFPEPTDEIAARIEERNALALAASQAAIDANKQRSEEGDQAGAKDPEEGAKQQQEDAKK